MSRPDAPPHRTAARPIILGAHSALVRAVVAAVGRAPSVVRLTAPTETAAAHRSFDGESFGLSGSCEHCVAAAAAAAEEARQLALRSTALQRDLPRPLSINVPIADKEQLQKMCESFCSCYSHFGVHSCAARAQQRPCLTAAVLECGRCRKRVELAEELIKAEMALLLRADAVSTLAHMCELGAGCFHGASAGRAS